MGPTRRLLALLVGCAVFCVVVSAGAGTLAAQSQPPPSADAHRAKTRARPAERPDVARFSKRLEAALDAPGPDKGFWGALVTDSATGEILYSLHPDNYFAPASDAKLFTTALALATLGPEYRIRTTLESAGPLGADGVLHGDLVLIGRGDANLSNRKFPYEKKVERDGPPEKVLAEMADAVAARGVKQIEGDVVADDSLLEPERYPSGWTIDDMLWSYGAAVSAVAVNDNTFTAELRPGGREGDPVAVSIQPMTNFYVLQNSVRTGARDSEETLAVARDPGSRTIRLTGAIPSGAAPRVLAIAIEEPAEYAAALLTRLLEARGVQIRGMARAHHAGDPALPVGNSQVPLVLAEHTSPPLAEDIRQANKNSLNLHAELMLRLAAREKAGATTLEQAQKFAEDFFKAAGIAGGDVVLYDGSGLSRRDLVTPRAVVRMLTYAASQPWGDLYRSSLPVAGEDGTLADRMKNTPAAGRVFAKTGTLDHVYSLSGYATTVRGARLVFSIFCNNSNLRAQAADEVLDALAVAMVEELRPAPAPRKNK